MESQRSLRNRPSPRILQAVLESHLPRLAEFLSFQEQHRLKQVNRLCYYSLIAVDLWGGLKLMVQHSKMEFTEDLEYEEVQVQPQNKLARNIRIHSLNKKLQAQRLVEKENGAKAILVGAVKKTIPPRFPSHHKPSSPRFMKTQIGFKRLGLTKAQPTYEYLLELPDRLELSNLQIRLNDNIAKNIERARAVGELLSRWTDYQKKLFEVPSDDGRPVTDSSMFWRQKESMYREYNRRFSQSTYQQLLAGFDKVLVIDQSIRKRHKAFMERHKTIMEGLPKIQSVRAMYEKVEVKLSQLRAADGIKSFELVEELLELFLDQMSRSKDILLPHIINHAEMVDQQLQQLLSQNDLSIRSLCCFPEQHELILQIIISLADKGLKLLEQAEGKFKQELLASKWRNCRLVAGSLSKMARYFNKIRLQLQAKERKNQEGSTQQIRNFLSFYENHETEVQLFEEKNRPKVEAEIGRLKARIEELKAKIRQK